MNELKNEISMSAKTRPWQKRMEFVDRLKGKLPDEKLAVIKRDVEKRSREAAQVQVTVTPVDTVQYCSPSPQTPELSPNVCVKLENNKGRMDPEGGELEPPSAGTGLETPGQQCPPNEATWEKGRTIADGYLHVSIGSNQGRDISSPTTERVDTRALRTTVNITFLQEGHKPQNEEKDSEENKQFDPSGKGEKAPLWNTAVISISLFLGGALGHGKPAACASCFCLCLSFCSVL